MAELDVIQALRAADPIKRHDTSRYTDVPGELLEQILISGYRQRGAQRLTFTRNRRRFATAFAVVAVLTISLLTINTPQDKTGGLASINAAAGVAAAQADTPAARRAAVFGVDTEVRLTRTESTIVAADKPFTVQFEKDEDWQINADGSGRIATEVGAMKFAGPRDRARWVEAGRPGVGGPESNTAKFGPGDLSATIDSDLPPIPDLPVEPDVLRDILVSHTYAGGRPANVALFETTGQVIANAWAYPQLRSALFKVLAGIPAVEDGGKATDSLGRAGHSISLESTSSGLPVVSQIVFDPSTAQLLMMQERLVGSSDIADGDLRSSLVVNNQGRHVLP